MHDHPPRIDPDTPEHWLLDRQDDLIATDIVRHGSLLDVLALAAAQLVGGAIVVGLLYLALR